MKLSSVREGDVVVPTEGCKDCLTVGRRYAVKRGTTEWMADLLCVECSVGEHFLFADAVGDELEHYKHHPAPRLVVSNGR